MESQNSNNNNNKSDKRAEGTRGTSGTTGSTGSTGTSGTTGTTGSTGSTGIPGGTGTSGTTGTTGSTGTTGDFGGKKNKKDKKQKGSMSYGGAETGKVYKSKSGSSGSDDSILSSIGGKGGLLGAIGALAGGALLYKAFKGSSGKSSSGQIVEATNKLTINKSREELYSYWRNLENLPNFMSHLKQVKEYDEKRSTWTARIPGGLGTVEWDAEIVQERENHLIVWKSLPGSEIENAGEVRFEEAPGGKGSTVETSISYRPPAGEAGSYVARVINPAFEKTVKNDLKQFKKLMEKGGSAKRKSKPAK